MISITESKNSNFYNWRWTQYLNNDSSFRQNRHAELVKLLLPSVYFRAMQTRDVKILNAAMLDMNLRSKSALDICCGFGSMSAALLENNVKNLTMIDGSLNTLRSLKEKFEKYYHNKTFSVDIKDPDINLEILQIDCDQLTSSMQKYFNIKKDKKAVNDKLDVAICRFAIHHLKCPFETVASVLSLLELNGTFHFNCFSLGCHSALIRDIRKYFLTLNDVDIINFIDKFDLQNADKDNDNIKILNHLINDNDEVVSFQNMTDIQNLSLVEKEMIVFLNSISTKYDMQNLIKKITPEDLVTRYIHNIGFDDMVNFINSAEGVELIDAAPDGSQNYFVIKKRSSQININTAVLPKKYFNVDSTGEYYF